MRSLWQRRRRPLEIICGSCDFSFRVEPRPVSNGLLLPSVVSFRRRVGRAAEGEWNGLACVPVEEWRSFMLDLVMLILGVGAFALLIGYVALCERL